jgi:hypothetical protein
MTIQIKPQQQLKFPDFWYGEVPGQKFEAWRSPNYPNVYFVALHFFVPEEDCKVLMLN